MTCFAVRTFTSLALAGAAFGMLGPAVAQDSDTVVRLDQLEHQMRQLTGTIEQLQFRNQQLEQALRRMQEDYELRFQQLGSKAAAPAGQARPSAGMQPATAPASQPNVAGRRSDAFDPTQNPNAPGAPRTLGSISANAAPPAVYSANGGPTSNEGPLGPPAARPAGAPLDLATSNNGALPPPPPRNPNATGGQFAAVSPPSQSPRDEYDLAYGYLLRKEYPSAADSFRTFLRDYPSDRMAADAQFWLGESMFQQQNYRDAADAFLTVTKTYENSTKAPDAMLRLGQSLAALGEKDVACATFTEVGRKFPRASLNVKQGVEREQKRVHCS